MTLAEDSAIFIFIMVPKQNFEDYKKKLEARGKLIVPAVASNADITEFANGRNYSHLPELVNTSMNSLSYKAPMG